MIIKITIKKLKISCEEIDLKGLENDPGFHYLHIICS